MPSSATWIGLCEKGRGTFIKLNGLNILISKKMKELIEVVKSNPMLYDKTHEDYMKIRLKDELWENIAKQLNYTDGK